MKNSNSENVENSVNHNDDVFENLDGSQEYYAEWKCQSSHSVHIHINKIHKVTKV